MVTHDPRTGSAAGSTSARDHHHETIQFTVERSCSPSFSVLAGPRRMWEILECRPIQPRRRSAMPDEARCSTRQAVRCAMVLRRRLILTRATGNPILSNDKAFKEIIRQWRHMIPPLVDTLTGQQLADINLGFRRFSNSTENLPTWLKETKSSSNLVTGY